MPPTAHARDAEPSAESALVALAMHGDREAFAELVRLRQSWLRNLLRRLCRDPSLADDLAQQAFLQAWRALPSLKATGAFGAWLRRLAVNAWLMHARSARSQLSADMDALEAGAAPTTGLALDLDRALAQLAPAERACVVLAYAEGLSHAEISLATGLPLGTVKSHIHRGSLRLRTLLEDYHPAEDQAHAG